MDRPSIAMETEAEVIIWAYSTKKHKMWYSKLLPDGENKILNSLNDLKPYRDGITIEKVDCVNPVQGGLTKGMIDKLTNYYRNAIMTNITLQR